MAITVDGYCYSWGCADGGWTGLERPADLSVIDPGPSNDRCDVVWGRAWLAEHAGEELFI